MELSSYDLSHEKKLLQLVSSYLLIFFVGLGPTVWNASLYAGGVQPNHKPGKGRTLLPGLLGPHYPYRCISCCLSLSCVCLAPRIMSLLGTCVVSLVIRVDALIRLSLAFRLLWVSGHHPCPWFCPELCPGCASRRAP